MINNDNDLSRRLQEMMAADPVDDPAHLPGNRADQRDDQPAHPIDSGANSDDMLQSALEEVGLDAMSPEARDMLMALTDESEHLEGAARERLVAAADRGLRSRREYASALPRLLFLRRREQGRAIKDVASHLSVAEKRLRKVESGDDPIDTLDAREVALWIAEFGVGLEEAEAALRTGMREAREPRRAAAVAAGEAPSGHGEFVAQVMEHLRSLYA